MGGRGAASRDALFPLTWGVVPINPPVPHSRAKGVSELGPDGNQSEPGKTGRAGESAGGRRALELQPGPCRRLLPPAASLSDPFAALTSAPHRGGRWRRGWGASSSPTRESEQLLGVESFTGFKK